MKISEFLSENFHFLVVKISVYFNRRVFVIRNTALERHTANLFSVSVVVNLVL